MVAGDSAARPRVLVTRPSADALPLAGDLQRRGFDVLLQPLLRIEFEDGPPPDVGGVQALLFTSANGVRAFARRTDLRTLPVYAVGDATATAARAERFLFVASAGGDVSDLAALLQDRLDPAGGRLLHVAGSAVAGDLAGTLEAAGFTVDRLQLYTAQKTEALDPSIHSALAAGAVDAALFFSPRSAASFVSLVRDAALAGACEDIRAFALSAAVAEALSPVSWRAIAVAPEPTQESLLATLEREVTDTSTPDAPAEQASQSNAGQSGNAGDLLDLGNAEAVVDRFGGIRPMASKLGIPVTTVQGWRGRGHIPANRIDEIRRAAAEHGVDLSAGPDAAKPVAAIAAPDAGSETGETAPPAADAPQAAATAPPPAPPQAMAGGSGVAWAALILAVVALAGVASYRYWAPLVGIQQAQTPAALAARVEKLESVAADTSGAQVAALSRKVDALSRQFADRAAGGAGNGKALAAATAEIESLRASVETLSQKVGQADASARAAGTEAQDALDTLRGEVAALRKTVSEVAGRVKAIEDRPPATGGKIAALAVAAGQLETAIDSGRPYAGALDRLKALAADDPKISETLTPLAYSASTGVPTGAALARRFEEIAPTLTVPAQAEAAGGWMATLRAKAMSLINMRPVGEGGDASPVTRAERALARNDLSTAVTALESVPAAGSWRQAAQRRLDADAAVGAVRARIVDRLADEAQTAETKRGTP
jgi:uroporphyrinogen-III synthase